MDYAGRILGDLLDKYERSVHFQGAARVKRRISFPFDRRTFPGYISGERPGEKEALHQAVKELAGYDIITVEWVSGEQNNLLRKVYLNLDKVDEAYNLAGRVSKNVILEEYRAMLKGAGEEMITPWIKSFLDECCRDISGNREIPSYLPSKKEDAALLLRALRGLEKKGETEMLERIFSISYLGGSKLFSRKVKAALIAAARRSFIKDPELPGEDVLHELGLVKTTEELLLAGPLTLTLKNRVVDLAPLIFGTVIDTQMEDELKIKELKAEKLLLVENKTNYHYLLRRGLPGGVLLIYLGGFPGPRKRRFLGALSSYCRNNKRQVKFLHWGDIDWGGMRIHQLLKEQALPALEPFYMDRETLLNYRDMAETFPIPYRSRLLKLRQSPRYAIFHHLIDLMLELNLRLEQEAILTKLPADFLD